MEFFDDVVVEEVLELVVAEPGFSSAVRLPSLHSSVTVELLMFISIMSGWTVEHFSCFHIVARYNTNYAFFEFTRKGFDIEPSWLNFGGAKPFRR